MQKQRNAKPFLKEFHVIVQAFVAILKVIETISLRSYLLVGSTIRLNETHSLHGGPEQEDREAIGTQDFKS